MLQLLYSTRIWPTRPAAIVDRFAGAEPHASNPDLPPRSRPHLRDDPRAVKVYGVEDESGRHYRFKTLGYDLNKLEELDRQAQEEARQLQELAILRDAKNSEREQDHDGFEREILEDNKDHTEGPESYDSDEETEAQDEND